MNKKKDAYKTIGEVAHILGLVNKKNGSLSTHTIRFWEKKFRQIKPKIFSGKRRYYDLNTIEIIENIKYLLKDKGMTIRGVKNALNNKDSLNLDESFTNKIINTSIKKKQITERVQKITQILEEIKKIKNG